MSHPPEPLPVPLGEPGGCVNNVVDHGATSHLPNQVGVGDDRLRYAVDHLLEGPLTERHAEPRGTQSLHRTTARADDPRHLANKGREPRAVATALVRRPQRFAQLGARQATSLVKHPMGHFRTNDRQRDDLGRMIGRSAAKSGGPHAHRSGKSGTVIVGSKRTCGWPGCPGVAPGLRRSAAVIRRWHFVEGASVEGGRLELDESRLSRASRDSTRLKRERNWCRTLVGVCCQSSTAMLSPAGKGAGSQPSRTMRSPRSSWAHQDHKTGGVSAEKRWEHDLPGPSSPVISYPIPMPRYCRDCGSSVTCDPGYASRPGPSWYSLSCPSRRITRTTGMVAFLPLDHSNTG